MLSFIVCALVPPTTFTRFMDESSRAILGISQGMWTLSSDDAEQGPFVTTVLLSGKRSRIRALVGGKVYADYAFAPDSMTMVDGLNRTITRWSDPTRRNAKLSPSEPLPALDEGSFDYRLDTTRGFVLRSNPPFDSARVDVEPQTETLVTSVSRDGKPGLDVRIVRDRRSKLPREMRVHQAKDDKTVVFAFVFVRRKVAVAELVIDPKEYVGFTEIASPGSTTETEEDRFVAESAKAVRDFGEGRLAVSIVGTDGAKQESETFRKGGVQRVRHSVAGQPYSDAQITPISRTYYMLADSTITEQAIPPEQIGKITIPPQAPNTTTVAVDFEQGVALRANPGFYDRRIARSGDEETLSAKWREANVTEWTITLVRDAKTRLPKLITMDNGKGEIVMRYRFEARPVTNAELWIDPATYGAFKRNP